MTFGLSDKGFLRKRLPDIKDDLENALKAQFGDINLAPDSVFGQMVGVFSKVLADVWESMEDVYYSQYPSTAEGFSLDNSVALIGVNRIAASKTRVIAVASGEEGTFLPSGTTVAVKKTGKLFESVADVTIGRSKAVKVTLEIIDVQPETLYAVIINAIPFRISSDATATKEEIAAALVASINAGKERVVAIDHLDGSFSIETTDIDFSFSISTDDTIEYTSIASRVDFQALETGPIPVPPNTLVDIVTTITGWDAVYNPVAGAMGRELETDKELRVRRLTSLRVLGAAAVEAIRSRIIQEVEGVRSVLIFENRTLKQDPSKIGFNFDFVADNLIRIVINDTDVVEVAFDTNQLTTMQKLKEELEKLSYIESVEISAAPYHDLVIHTVPHYRTIINSATVFDGFSQPDAIISTGRPGKSFECIVAGGLDQEIAQKIWQVKPAGIESHGNVREIIVDSTGFEQVVKFSRATKVWLHVKAEVSIYDEEAFPANGLELIKEQILAFGQSLDVGQDVIVQRFLGPIYRNIDGIAGVNISIAVSSTEEGIPGAFSAANLEILDTEIADFNLDRIAAMIV